MKRIVVASGLSGRASREQVVDALSHTALSGRSRDWGTIVTARRSESADFNFELLAALAACVAFWVLVALTVYWLV